MLGPAETRYSATDREALAIPWALEHFNTYCEGHKYVALTDHAALRYMLNNKDKTPRMHRMVAKLSPYEITLYYKPGSENHAADLLSRESVYMQSANNTTTDNVEVNVYTRSSANKSSRADASSSSSPATAVSAAHPVTVKRRRKPRLSDETYEVERILDRRVSADKPTEVEYLVKWKGWDDENDNTWETLATLKDASDSVVDFEIERQQKEIGGLVLQYDNFECNDCSKKCNNPTDLVVHQVQRTQTTSAI